MRAPLAQAVVRNELRTLRRRIAPNPWRAIAAVLGVIGAFVATWSFSRSAGRPLARLIAASIDTTVFVGLIGGVGAMIGAAIAATLEHPQGDDELAHLPLRQSRRVLEPVVAGVAVSILPLMTLFAVACVGLAIDAPGRAAGAAGLVAMFVAAGMFGAAAAEATIGLFRGRRQNALALASIAVAWGMWSVHQPLLGPLALVSAGLAGRAPLRGAEVGGALAIGLACLWAALFVTRPARVVRERRRSHRCWTVSSPWSAGYGAALRVLLRRPSMRRHLLLTAIAPATGVVSGIVGDGKEVFGPLSGFLLTMSCAVIVLTAPTVGDGEEDVLQISPSALASQRVAWLAASCAIATIAWSVGIAILFGVDMLASADVTATGGAFALGLAAAMLAGQLLPLRMNVRSGQAGSYALFSVFSGIAAFFAKQVGALDPSLISIVPFGVGSLFATLSVLVAGRGNSRKPARRMLGRSTQRVVIGSAL
jgi:hypothetical protein